MKNLEIMRKTVIFLIVWNLLITAGLLLNINNDNKEEKLNQQICILEEIPTEELQ